MKINHLNRRDFIKVAGAGALISSTSLLSACASLSNKKASIGRVVIIGGGYGGTTAAKYIRLWSNGNIDVTVIEKSAQFVSCPMSNLVLGGSKSINDLTFGYDLVQKNHGVNWVNDEVTALDLSAKKVTMKRGEITYDRLIIAPGIDFMYDELPSLASAEAQIGRASCRERVCLPV